MFNIERQGAQDIVCTGIWRAKFLRSLGRSSVWRQSRRKWPITISSASYAKEWGLEKMNFEMLLDRAKAGDKEAREEIFRMYRPLLIKNSMDQNVFDEDLYQELSATLLNCIQKFRI